MGGVIQHFKVSMVQDEQPDDKRAFLTLILIISNFAVEVGLDLVDLLDLDPSDTLYKQGKGIRATSFHTGHLCRDSPGEQVCLCYPGRVIVSTMSLAVVDEELSIWSLETRVSDLGHTSYRDVFYPAVAGTSTSEDGGEKGWYVWPTG